MNDRETLTHTARGGEYRDVTRELPVTVDDDEEVGVVLSPTSLGPIAEGTDVSYTVRLSSEPTATTTVEIGGHEDASVALDRMSLTFTADNWDTPQTVTVTATQDDDAVDDEITLTHTANGGDYVDVTKDLTVTVTDDEETNVLVSRAELSVEEGNATGTSYTVRLTSEPTAAVTVEIGGHSGTDLRLSGVSTSSTLTFTASNWDTAQTVTVRANEDPDAADDTATLTHTASGGDYAGVTRDLPVTVDDDETASLVVTPTEIGVVEDSATGTTYTVELSHVPTETVTVTIGGHSATDLAGQDPDAADDTATLTHTANGGDYVDVTRELAVTVDDDETASIVLSESSLEPDENATGTTYTVRLSHVPVENVTITIEGHDGTDLTLSTTTLTFTDSRRQLERGPDCHRHRGPRRRCRQRPGHPHTHREWRRLPGCDGEGGCHGGRRRGDQGRTVRGVPGAGRGGRNPKLHGEAVQRAHRNHHGRDRRPRGHLRRTGQKCAHLHCRELGHPPDRDGDGELGRQCRGRAGDPGPHGQRRGLRGRHQGPARQGGRRRGDQRVGLQG